MIFNIRALKVYLYRDFIDMRKGHDGLYCLIRNELNCDPMNGSIYIFFSRNRRITKSLYWDGTGLVLVHKRLEKGRFMATENLEKVQEITMAELALIFEGTKIKLPLSKKEFILK